MAAIKQSGIDYSKIPVHIWEAAVNKVADIMIQEGTEEEDIISTVIDSSYRTDYLAHQVTIRTVTTHRIYHVDFLYEEP